MSQVLILRYLAELDRLKRVSGTHREGVVSEAFKDLLKGWGKQHDLVFVPQYRLDSATKDNRSALEWVLGPHKEKKPKDSTIREKFDTYRFADYTERVVTLLGRVARVSVAAVAQIKSGRR